MYGVGRGKMYQLGKESVYKQDMGTDTREGPVPITLPERIAKVCAGKNHSVFLGKETGKVYAMGDNRYA